MSEEKTAEIQRRLDEELSLEKFKEGHRPEEDEATQFFQDLFVEVLNYEMFGSSLGDETWTGLPVHEWPQAARTNKARLISESGNFRVIYAELEKLTRTAERNAVRSITRSEQTGGWAIEGSFLIVFHAPDDDVWHLVTPYEEDTPDITSGRPVLRRYTLGEGETHHTVSHALAQMDASLQPHLAGRVDEAFSVKPVTEDFYENYKNVFDKLESELRGKGLEIEEADRYSHVILNRLMFFYYLQKKGWIGGRKDFVDWFHQQYKDSEDSGVFHEKWLSSLFFEGMNQPEGSTIEADLPGEVEEVVSGLAHMNGGLFQPSELDENDVYVSDDMLDTVIHSFLEQYNFTVTEESPYDIDVAVDPAMLGKIYESLIAEQERGEAGIFYTPRVEVDLMCRMALYEQFCDHANGLDDEGKERIVEFVFSEPQDWDSESAGETEELEEILHELRIVDPACGSGAFLVGMKQVLSELYRKLGKTPDYHLKEQIINENLYGVDIKDWAVRVAEFRLWLSLVEGEEQIPDQRPVLPNFSFKLRVGDSLIQKLDEEFVSLDSLSRNYEGDTGGLHTELRDLKREHFEGEADRTEEIEEKQVELLRTHIDGLIDNLSNNLVQGTLDGETKAEKTANDTEERIEDLKEVREAINDAGSAGFFMWDIDFSDVMVEGGFDIVIGNPPYVRQEDIIDQGIHPDRLEEMDSSEVSKLKKQYKNDLVESVQKACDIKPYKRSDIYVYFYFKGINLLRENGTLSFITSNSWLDIGYGKRLHEGLLKLTDLSYILGNTSEKSFEDADVNTYITIANRKQGEILAGRTDFVNFQKPFFDYDYSGDFDAFIVNSSENADPVELDNEELRVSSDNGLRTVSIGHDSLWRLGGGTTKKLDDNSIEGVFSEEVGIVRDQSALNSISGNHAYLPTGSYDDGMWGRFITAPMLYFKLWRDHGDRFSLLGDHADPSSGLMYGATKFFVVPAPGKSNTHYESDWNSQSGHLLLNHSDSNREFKIDHKYWMRKRESFPSMCRSEFKISYTDSQGETWVPNYVLQRNRELKTSPVMPEHLSNVHLRIIDSKSELGPDTKEYVEFGEENRWGKNGDKALSDRSSFNSRDPWYDQPTVSDPYILLPLSVNAKYQYHYNPCGFEVSKNFFYADVDGELFAGHVAAFMNSTIGWFLAENTGRSWTNTLRYDKPEYERFPLMDAKYDIQEESELRLNELMERNLDNVFEELGAYNPNNVSLDSVNTDRRNLDKVFFDQLGYTEDDQLEMYQEVVTMVRNRLMRQPDENPSLCETIAEHNPQYDHSR